MKTMIRTKPVYFILLSLFFVFHGYTENYDFIPVWDAFLLFALYLGSSVVLAAIFWLIYRNISKACFTAFLFMAFYFFFGYIYDSVYAIAPGGFFSKYSVLLSGALLFLLIMMVIVFLRKTSLLRLNYVLNVFFIALLVVDGVWLAVKVARPANFSAAAGQISVCDSCNKPDIYFILADEYAGDSVLKELMGFDNHEFKNQLARRGFYSPVSSSNYNFTPFSIASMFQMDYLKGIEGKNTSHSDLSLCYNLIRENRACQFLYAHGYAVYNYSIFDIHDQPSLVKESVLPERTRFITAQTLFNRIDNNILFNMAHKLGPAEKKRRLMMAYNSNVKAIDSLKQLVTRKTTAPRFVYTHLIMPHYPYYFDKNGVRRELQEMEDVNERNLGHYSEYVQYTNGILLDLIDQILSHSAKLPIIMLVSDHGFREFPNPVDNKYLFMNLLSVYLPNHDYSSFYNGISNVNLFRTLFNQQFHQHFKILKDSTSYLRP